MKLRLAPAARHCAALLLTVASARGQYVCGPEWMANPAPVDGTVFVAGTWSQGGPPLLILGGSFTAAGGVAANNIAAFDGSAWSPLGNGLNGVPRALAVYQGDLIAGGAFTAAGDGPANHVARWDGARWSPLGEGFNMQVHALAVYQDELYAGGWFTLNGTQSIARWDGSAWVPVGSGVSIQDCPGYCGTSVDALAVYRGQLVAGGYFTMAGGLTTRYLARWDGSRWHAVGGGANNDVNALAVYNDQLIAGGSFTRVAFGSRVANRIAAWNGSAWSTLGDGMGGRVTGLTVHDGRLFAGGWFTQAQGSPADYIAAWNGTDWAAMGSGMDSLVHGLAVYEGDVIAVGHFANAGGVSSLHWARWRDTPPPLIDQHPASQVRLVGEEVTLSAAASSARQLPLRYQWRKGGLPLSDGPDLSGVTTAELTLSSVHKEDTGLYDVVVTDCASTTSAGAYLSVVCPLSVTGPAPPFQKSVDLGSTVTTSVTVSGARGQARFSWRRNGTVLTDDFHLSGSTADTLIISPAGTRDSGRYDVVVSDDCGSITSGAAALTVRCSATSIADLDADCDVDMADVSRFLACASGPAIPAVISPACPGSRANPGHAVADLDLDGDVDQDDFGVIQRCLSGANLPPSSGCGP